MTGQQIFDLYQQFRDYSGSEADAYAQELDTMYGHCSLNGEEEEFSVLLKEAHEACKKLEIKGVNELQDFYTLEDITIKY